MLYATKALHAQVYHGALCREKRSTIHALGVGHGNQCVQSQDCPPIEQSQRGTVIQPDVDSWRKSRDRIAYAALGQCPDSI